MPKEKEKVNTDTPEANPDFMKLLNDMAKDILSGD